jgi:hypothetical protein
MARKRQFDRGGRCIKEVVGGEADWYALPTAEREVHGKTMLVTLCPTVGEPLPQMLGGELADMEVTGCSLMGENNGHYRAKARIRDE